MLYVERGKDGMITALHNRPGPTAQEQKSMMDEEVLAFFDTADSWKQFMEISDLRSVRILEDLIDLLISKNIINFTELPKQAQQKILERKHLRKKIDSQSLLVNDIL
ncbi:MAG: hypothetical protein PHR66_06260 [Desulfuromonadaceae bacterium]|nr:hypothetical protein [Desulfuromonadaceae bacterium]